MVCYVIVTFRTLLWMFLGLVGTLAMLSALLNPKWICADPETVKIENVTVTFTSCLGVYAKCGRPVAINRPICTLLAVDGLAADWHIFPSPWKAATVFLAIGLSVMVLTVLASFLSCCKQSLCRKSIFTLAGVAQCIAGIFFILGVMLHPMAWGSHRVQQVCSTDASPFYLGQCHIGLGLYIAAIGTAITFISAYFSIQADKSSDSDRVQQEVYEGRTLICLP